MNKTEKIDALVEAGKKLRLFEQLTDWVWMFDAGGTYLYSNQAIIPLLGYHASDMLERSAFQFIHSADQTAVKKALQAAVCQKTGWQKLEIRWLHQDGSIRSSESSAQPVLDEKGVVQGFIGIDRDVSKQREAEVKLRDSEKRFRTLIEQAPFSIELFDTQGNWLHGNKAWEQLWGIKPEEARGIFNIFADKQLNESGVVDLFKKAVQGEIIRVPDLKFDASKAVGKGHTRWISTTFYPLIVNDERPEYIVIIHQDITDRKEAEEQLRQAQKMEAIGILTGGIAHEFNNLLSPIIGYVELLSSRKSADDPDLVKLERIYNAAERAKNLVQQMLAYGRKTASQREAVCLERIIDDTIELIQNTISPDIGIKKEIEVGLSPVFGMPNELHQVLLNLCINGCHAMPTGGTLKISLQKAPADEIINGKTLAGQSPAGFIRFSVQDTGRGMDQETIARIFDPFFTTKKIGEGSGLGLSLVQGIIEQHDGHIRVDSQPGQGSTFHIYLPVFTHTVKRSRTKQVGMMQNCGHILLIDDEEMLIEVTKVALEELGYSVSSYLDAEQALQCFKKNPHDFDLVITDYGMAEMDGKTLAKKVKAIEQNMPVILFTGHHTFSTMEDLYKYGIDRLLMKPFKIKELCDVVQSALQQDTHNQ